MKEIIGAGILIVDINDAGKVLLGKRKSELGYLEWSLPGGKKELNEDIFITAYREVKEETGTCINNLQFLFKKEDTVNNIRYTTYHYLSRHDLSNINLSGNNEFFEWCVYDIHRVPDPVFCFSKDTLMYYMENCI